jgi:hypothetical protein
MYISIRDGPLDSTLAPRPSMIYCVLLRAKLDVAAKKTVLDSRIHFVQGRSYNSIMFQYLNQSMVKVESKSKSYSCNRLWKAIKL